MPATPALFEARSTPLHSLSDQGFWIVAGILVAGFTFTGVVFTILGAWPVMAFAGVEGAMVVGLLALYRRHARRSAEFVVLTPGQILVRRRDGPRREEARFDPFWARLRWEGPKLFLGHREAQIEIGRFLAPEERVDLEQALGAALTRYREPRFDNPQLRD